MPKGKDLAPDQVPGRGKLIEEQDLTLECYIENGDGSWTGYKSHDLHDEPSVIEYEGDGRPIGSYKLCSRCGWHPYGAY